MKWAICWISCVIFLVTSCGNGHRDGSLPSPTLPPLGVSTEGSIQANIGDAEHLLGFTIVAPRHTPLELQRKEEVDVIISGGKPVRSQLVFFSPNPDIPGATGITFMTIAQSAVPPAQPFPLPETIRIGATRIGWGTEMYGEGVRGEAAWEKSGMYFRIDILAVSNVDLSRLRDEVAKVLDSMLTD